MKVALVCMPFHGVDFPAFGLEVLKKVLQENEIACDLFYLNLPFAKKMEEEMYRPLAESDSFTSMVGDYIFSQYVFTPTTKKEAAEYINYVLSVKKGVGNIWRTKEVLAAKIEKGMLLAAEFLEEWARYDWSQYDLIGFTSSFQQNMATYSLAKRIKEAHDCYILMGGANCQGTMANAIIENFPYIDAVCNSEGETAILKLIDMIAAKKAYSIPGIVTQKDPDNKALAPKIDINQVPLPDFNTYLAAMKELMPEIFQRSWWPYESSRGCWWGQKNQCKFCGLNGHSLEYRTKKPAKILEELAAIKKKYGEYNGSRIFMIDNIVDMKYFDTLFPKIKENNLNVTLFCETKANLNQKQIAGLYEAGVRMIQPGVESLSSHALKLMNKGVTALQNIRLLRLCREYGIFARWHLLIGFVGENEADYDDQIKLFDKLYHLTPPLSVAKIRLDRFSPYFNNPEQEGIKITGGLKTYQFLYREQELSKFEGLFSYFEYDYLADHIWSKKIDQLEAAVAKWEESIAHVELFMNDQKVYKVENNILYVEEITVLEKEILSLTSNVISSGKLIEKLSVNYLESEIDATLMAMIDKGWLVEEKKSYLRIVLDTAIYKPNLKAKQLTKGYRVKR